MPNNAAKRAVIEAGRKLVESGLIARTWGNVSCRIDENSFVITPSGRGYLALTPGDLVQVSFNRQTRDLTYTGKIKPSSEKAVHAEVYKLYPEANFVIHTHQEDASVIAASGVSSIPVGDSYPTLGREVICAEYALPGAGSLAKKVKTALKKAKGKAVIMKYHGALCFGKDSTEAFRVAFELEQACGDFIARHGMDEYIRKKTAESGKDGKSFYHSRRTEKGFILYDTENEIEIPGERGDHARAKTTPVLPPGGPPQAKIEIYQAIYRKNQQINHIIFKSTPEILAVSCSGAPLKPLLDDFAQIIGMKADIVKPAPVYADAERTGARERAQKQRTYALKIAKALKRSSAVLLENTGALCCGKTKDDAVAAGMIMQKACKAFWGATSIRKGKPPHAVNPLESMVMRLVYLMKYSKQAGRDG